MNTRKKWRICLNFLSLVLVILSCRLPSNLFGPVDVVEPTETIEEIAIEFPTEEAVVPPETVEQTEVKTPTITATPDLISSFPEHVQEALRWEIRFKDDLIDPSGLWPTDEGPYWRAELRDGQYHWTINLSEVDRDERIFSRLVPAWMNVTDLSASLKGMVQGGCLNTAYGLSFRNYNHEAYIFTIRGDSYRLAMYNFLYNEEIADPIIDWTFSEAIIVGEMNELGVTANGENITLFINNEIVADILDDNYSAGDVRLVLDLSVSGDTETFVVDDVSIRTRASTIYEEAKKWPLLLQESFETNEYLWEIGDSSTEFYDAEYKISNGSYHIQATAKQEFIETVLPKALDDMGDFFLTARVGPIEFIEGSHQGILFRYGDAGYYWYGIHNDWLGPNLMALIHYQGESIQKMPPYSIALRRDETVTLGVIAKGDRFVLLARDQVVGDFVSTKIQSGIPGIAFGLAEAVDTSSFIYSSFSINSPDVIE